MTTPSLLRHHRDHLHRSAISDEVIDARGYSTVRRPTAADGSPRDLLRACGIPRWAWREDARFPGIRIPLYRATGERISWQYRPDVPPKDPKSGKRRKYAAQQGRPNVLDVHPLNRDRIVDPSVELWITEGVKKGDALTTAGACVVTLSGVFNWRSQLGTLGDWEDVPLRGRSVVVCFDADARTNGNVARAMERLGRWLKSKGATPRYVVVPAMVGETEVKGADDFLAAGGHLAELRAAAANEAPTPAQERVALSDALLAEDAADEALENYRWARGLGWLRWDGRRWQRTPDEAVREQVRQWIVTKHGDASRAAVEAAATGDMNRAKTLGAYREAWFGYMNRSRIEAVAALARGIARADADDFDAYPDLLNVANGVVDLPTGMLLPHHPDLMLTRITLVDYRPGAQHGDWEAALTALPDDVRDWYRLRCGQAITGHMTPDDLMIVQQGGGENGKTTITEGIRAALGEYHTLVSHRALLGDPGQHPTELMTFRGARYALLEETPEERRLSVVRLKQTVGTPQMKARHIRQDEVAWDATHSLFLSTNYKPVVEETDHGTWRRLALLSFPYTFRKPHEQLLAPHERRGDPTLRERIADGRDGRREAVLAWLVSGAVDWYKGGRVMPAAPPRVEQETRAWRAESDLVLAYLDERIVFAPGAHVMSTELLTDFNEWLTSRGHRLWSDRTFASRFGGHSEATAHRVEKRFLRRREGLSRRTPAFGIPLSAVPGRYHAWLGLCFRTDADDQGKHASGSGGSGVPENRLRTRGTDGYPGHPIHPIQDGDGGPLMGLPATVPPPTDPRSAAPPAAAGWTPKQHALYDQLTATGQGGGATAPREQWPQDSIGAEANHSGPTQRGRP